MPSGLLARTRSTVTTAAVLTATAVLPAAGVFPEAARAASPAGIAPFEQQVLFEASQEPGYACFRIPALVRTTAGTLLAFAEGRVLNCGDAADIDIVVKRSTDGGRTWGALQVVTEGAGDTHGNPAPVVDRETGRVLLAQTHNTGRTDAAGCGVPCDRTPHLQHSDDDGRTWSAPRELSGEIAPPHWNAWYATGPGHGVQLAHGTHAGRLVFGVNAETWDGGRVTENHAALVVSDDGGDHWRIGATDSWPVADDGVFRQKPSELTVTELADGAILVSGREQDGTDLGHRTQAVSGDGGDTFDAPFEALPDLYTPQVQGAVLRLGSRLLLSAPADPDRRRTMMIRSSPDGGRTWDSVDRGTVVTRDWAGYSDMAEITPDTVGLLYEAGAADARDEIRFARFTEDWLVPPRGPDPVTPDVGPYGERAAVLGGAAPVPDGALGGALALDGADDAVRLPHRAQLALGTGEFTASLWFRYTAGSGEQPLLSVGGAGGSQPGLRLWAEPAHDRLRGLITVREGARAVRTAEVSAAGARDDGRWHRLVLRRGNGRLTLSVDGAAAAETADVPGSLSRNAPFGVHIGQRMDARAFFAGAIDEVRLWNRALADGEPDGASLAGTVLWLPMDRVDRSR
ncbi:exo-alpha-sialidase [Streptomyces sp. JB150]|uniref:exo-alpha-sialidase n=1 Tax=Streptomyces sp. JB150 TaxID=2714844 RepID=UPI00140C1696|nr:exo-alpha-sialidase [Streptomyces sp. JB150]QIJ65651.1 laminin G [Streptomyces sp. JB150]